MKKLMPFFAIAVIALFAVSCTSNDPVGLTKQYMDAVKSGDAETLIELSKEHGSEFEKRMLETMSEEELEKKIAKAKEEYEKSQEEGDNLENYEILDDQCEIGETEAKVKVRLTLSDGTTDVETFRFKKENDVWIFH